MGGLEEVRLEGNGELTFQCIDDTPGGRNLGRIERHLEPIFKYDKSQKWYTIKEVLLWAGQTRGEHDGKLYKLDADIPAFEGGHYKEDNYFSRIWKTGYCREHKVMNFSAYPLDHHTKIKFQLYSGVYGRVWFE